MGPISLCFSSSNKLNAQFYELVNNTNNEEQGPGYG